MDPIQPKRDNFSLRIIWDRMADITTDNAPMGVWTEVRIFEDFCFTVLKDRKSTYDHDSFHEGISCEVTYLPCKNVSTP